MKIRVGRRVAIPALAASGALIVVAAGAAAAVETDTVASFGRGLWWSLALMTTVGFIGAPPLTATGAVLSVILMVSGFFLLAVVSAPLASLFVREDEQTHDAQEHDDLGSLRAEISSLREQLDQIQDTLRRAADG